MKDIVEILAALNKDPGAISASYHRIDSFHKLILDENPYGQIDPNGIVQGLIEIDGPAQDPPNAKTPLQWHFGGTAIEISKAIRIQYGYQKYSEGIQINATGSLFIGYELQYPYPPDPERVKSRLEMRKNADGEGKGTPAVPFAAIEAARAARQSRAPGDFMTTLRSELAVAPSTVTRVAKYVVPANFDAFVEENLPFTGARSVSGNGVEPLTAIPSRSALTGFVPAHNPGPAGIRIEFDGPARDNNSKSPFPYTAQTLFMDPSGLYERLLWWYFGGRAFRITKAMRIEYNDLLTQALLIGYQGPSFP